jgi:hypothetical protein
VTDTRIKLHFQGVLILRIFPFLTIVVDFKRFCDSCGSSGGWSPVSYTEGSGSIVDQSMWDLCCTKWHWDRFYTSALAQFQFKVSVAEPSDAVQRMNG